MPSNIIDFSLRQDQILSNEGVHILPVKQNIGSHQYLCSPQGSRPVKIKHTCISRAARPACRLACAMLLLALAFSAGAALAQQPQTIEQIRVIGNRRIPKETMLARLFTHPGDVYDPDFHRARLQLALEYRLLRGSAHRARGLGEGHHPQRFRPGKTDYPRDQLQGPEFGLPVGCAGPLQEGKGPHFGGKPVRPHQDQARRDRLKDILCGARTPVCHYQNRG